MQFPEERYEVAVTRVLLIVSHPLARRTLRAILETQRDMRVVGEIPSDLSGTTDLPESDVVVLDCPLPDRDLLRWVHALRTVHGSTLVSKLIVLSSLESAQQLADSLDAGVSGHLARETTPERLLSAVRAVTEGHLILDSGAPQKLLAELAVSSSVVTPRQPSALLTAREYLVFRLLAQGMANAQIASRLKVSEATVKTHVSKILAKLELRSRYEAIAFAYRHDVV